MVEYNQMENELSGVLILLFGDIFFNGVSEGN